MAPKLKPETLEERRTQILRAALTCFARKGYHHTTMDDIVRKAGLSKGGLYWHFSSKKELFLALFDSLISGTEAILTASLASQASAKEKLRAMLDMFTAMGTMDEFQEVMPLMIDVWAQNWQDPEVNEAAVAIYNRFRGPMMQLIEEGIASGEFKPVNAKALTSILFATYDGLIVQWMIDRSMVDWAAVNETMMNTLVAGLLADRASNSTSEEVKGEG
jgi:AcrR family transcriptional regulator